MHNPRVFLAYAPRAGLRCALVYIAGERDAYGWFIGPAGGELRSAYFVLEDQYTPRPARYIEVPEGELHGRWTRDEARCHELATLQEALRREWLVFRDDPEAAGDFERYAEGELAAGAAAIRFERLNRFGKEQPNWTHYSHDCELSVLRALSRHWPLDFRVEEE